MKSNRQFAFLRMFAFPGILVLFSLNGLFAEDVTRFRGDNSQGKYIETGLMDRWPEDGLKPKWLIEDLGEGWSSVIKVKDRLYLNCLDADNAKRESVVCLDLNGKKLWQQAVGAIWSKSYPLPRATPTYVPGEQAGEGKLLLLSGSGDLFCLDAKDGKTLWEKNVAAIYEAGTGHWGMAESVVVKDGKVFVTPCGKKALTVALDIADGSSLWEAEPLDDDCAYITPVLHGNQLIVMTRRYVSGIDIENGKLLWRSDYQEIVGPSKRSDSNCISPLVKGNRVFVAAGYDQGGVMYEIQPDGRGVRVVWMTKVLDPHHHGIVEVNGRIYGSNWINNGNGNWCCLDWDTGETIYETPWEKLGKGVIIFADGKLFLYEEKRGTLGLAKVGDRFEVVSSFPIGFGTKEHWAHPVISDGVLYVRHGNALAAYDIAEK